MGAAIITQTLGSIAVAVALFRQRFEDLALGWALRFGMSLTIAGALMGGLMTRPTSAQVQAAQTGAPLTVVGAHTVGAPDGGAGLVGVGWSTTHGDLRVPHFLGLHAMQMLPLLAFLLMRLGVSPAPRARLMIVAGISESALCGMLLVQALRGVPLIAPDTTTLVQLVVWAMATLIAAGLAARDTACETEPMAVG
jgi:hypothetical protein